MSQKFDPWAVVCVTSGSSGSGWTWVGVSRWESKEPADAEAAKWRGRVSGGQAAVVAWSDDLTTNALENPRVRAALS